MKPSSTTEGESHVTSTHITDDTVNGNTSTYKNVLKYIFTPISREEIKYFCLVICTIIGTALTYFVPNIVSSIFVSLLTIILCILIATVIWMWTVLPTYKRVQFIERIKDIFNYSLNSYLSKRDNEFSKTDRKTFVNREY